MTTDLGPPDSGAPSSPPSPERRGRAPRQPRRSPGWWRGVREIALIVVLWLCYSAGRNLAHQDRRSAHQRAIDILDVEKALHIDVEHWLNHAVGVSWIAIAMCFWYAALHYLVTPAVLVFVYLRHREDYARARNALVLASMIALVCFIFLPTEPPRLADLGYIDTMKQTAKMGYGWWSGHASAPAGMQGLTNELAAMPSLHVGWTLWVAWALWPRVNVVGRALACFYVAGTTMVVICTGNHWILDVVAGLAVVALAIWIVSHTAPLRQDDGVVRMVWMACSRVRQACTRRKVNDRLT